MELSGKSCPAYLSQSVTFSSCTGFEEYVYGEIQKSKFSYNFFMISVNAKNQGASK